MSIKREFIPYEQALALKELGFDEPCFGIYYNKTREFVLGKIVNEYTLEVRTWAPLYQQAFRWLYQKLNIEKDIKLALKQELKSIVSCGVDPSIPSFLKYGNSGIVTEVKKVDFFDMLLTDPTTIGGSLMYDDVSNQLNSTDFNTFLYSNIEQNKSDFTPNGGTSSPWGSSTIGSDVIDLKFSPVGTPDIGNNVIKVTTNSNFDNKTLIEFNNSFIDLYTNKCHIICTYIIFIIWWVFYYYIKFFYIKFFFYNLILNYNFDINLICIHFFYLIYTYKSYFLICFFLFSSSFIISFLSGEVKFNALSFICKSPLR